MKYLVRKIFEEEIVTIDGIDTIVKTNNVLEYQIKGTTTAPNLPRGGDYVFINGVDTKFPEIVTNQETGQLEIIENISTKDLKGAYDLMDNEIRIEAAIKIGTTNKDSLFAFVDAFQLRMMIPDRYIGLGLVAQIEIGGFLVGDALDDATKVKNYYTEILFYLDTHRLSKINTYLETKSTLGF